MEYQRHLHDYLGTKRYRQPALGYSEIHHQQLPGLDDYPGIFRQRQLDAVW